MRILKSYEAPLVVHWLDAVASFGVAPEEIQLVRQTTIGWAHLGEDEGTRAMVLVHSSNSDGKGEATAIPVALITRVETLRRQVVWEGEVLRNALEGSNGTEREVVAGSEEETGGEE